MLYYMQGSSSTIHEGPPTMGILPRAYLEKIDVDYDKQGSELNDVANTDQEAFLLCRRQQCFEVPPGTCQHQSGQVAH